MTTKDFKRKLSAILSADVAGYSRLMGEDESATVEAITTYREIMAELIKQHRGRVIDSPGDNILAEFASVVDAVQCAVSVQKELQARNAELPENRRMEFRIGINLGDVIEEEERIYGDGVNIAARLEALADPGGICVSKTAFDQIETKLPVGYEYLGEKEVKNIAKPVGAFRVLMDEEAAGKVIGKLLPKTRQLRGAVIGAVVVLILVAAALVIWNSYFRPQFEPASVEKMAYPLPDKPSIAVLPFTNMSGDPKQEYFSDGMTEQIITGLSNVPKLFVMSRSATFTYKGKPVKPKQVAEDLGVQYVLEGSVQRSGDRIRITAQLIDALAGHHLWAERYDRELKDIFALQDEITIKIMTAMEVKLTKGEQARVFEKGTKKLNAYLKLLKAREHRLRNNKEDNILAQRMAKEAIALDPEYAFAYHVLSVTHLQDVMFGLSKSPKVSMVQAIKLSKKAIELDESLAQPHGLLAVLYVFTRQYEKVAAECELALELGPNDERAHMAVGTALRYTGRWADAIPVYEKAIRLNPFPMSNTYFGLGIAYCFTGQFDKGIEACQRATHGNPNDLLAHVVLTAAYSMGGREEEARATSEKVMGINPKFTVKSFEKKVLRLKNKSDVKRYVEALRRAGLPYKPPLPLPDKPSIAVLPFENMSGDPEQEYFSDGITEEIITALSKVPYLFVIARNSSFTYKGKPVWIPTVGKELGVRYVLEGSVRKAGDTVRVTAQLVDAKTAEHLWAERWDRNLKDIFAIQDEITMKIITELRVKLTVGEQARLSARGTKNLEAYLKYLEGVGHSFRFNKADNAVAKRLAEQAIALDPEYPSAYRLLCGSHILDVWLKSTDSPKQSITRGKELIEKAIALDPSDPASHASLAMVFRTIGQHEKAIVEGEKAVALGPNSAWAYSQLGAALRFAGVAEESIPVLKKALRLSPLSTGAFYSLGFSYLLAGQCGEAIQTCKEGTDRNPNDLFAQLCLASAYSACGREEEARAAAAEVLRITPKFSVDYFSKTTKYKKQEDKELLIDGLRKAGLK